MAIATNNLSPYYGAYSSNNIYGQPVTPTTSLINPTPAPVVDAAPPYVNPQNQIPTINLNGRHYYTNSNGSMIGLGNNSAYGINQDGQSTWNGATGFQWAGIGLQTAATLFNAYQGYKQQKLAKQQVQDQMRLNHANYRMQAKAFNNNLRNQQSGRGYIGMTASAKQALGAEYQTRKAADDY